MFTLCLKGRNPFSRAPWQTFRCLTSSVQHWYNNLSNTHVNETVLIHGNDTLFVVVVLFISLNECFKQMSLF